METHCPVLATDFRFCSIDIRELRNEDLSGIRGSAVMDEEDVIDAGKLVCIGEGRSVVSGAGISEPEGITKEMSRFALVVSMMHLPMS